MRLYRRENCVIVVHYRLFEKLEEPWVGKAILEYSLLREEKGGIDSIVALLVDNTDWFWIFE